ncbi:Uncharacterized protein TCM_030909, partial [Theobroma cacao]
MATSEEGLSKNTVWLLDSAYSHHLTGNKSLFSTLYISFKSKVKIGDGNYLDILGIGIVKVETASGDKCISNVHYVSSANHNLLSVGQLAKDHYTLLFNGKVCTLIDPNGDELYTVAMRNNCYPLNLAKNTSHLALYSELDISEKWHRRFGHVNYSSLSLMSAKSLVKGLLGIVKPSKLCKACQLKKQTRKPFPKQSGWKASRKLELVHTDISGPIKTASLSGSRYWAMLRWPSGHRLRCSRFGTPVFTTLFWRSKWKTKKLSEGCEFCC